MSAAPHRTHPGRAVLWGLALALAGAGCASRAAGRHSLERRIRELEDQVYRLRRDNEDLAARLARVEPGAAPAPRPASRATPPEAGEPAGEPSRPREPVRALSGTSRPPASGGDAGSHWDRARELYQAARFEPALAALGDFRSRFPDDPRGEEAQFLVGECYYALGNFAQAVVEYAKVPEGWPAGRLGPDAVHKTALSYYELGYEDNALLHLEQLERSWPRSAAAQAGRPLLEKLRKRKRGR